jgi:hypothetical protein
MKCRVMEWLRRGETEFSHDEHIGLALPSMMRTLSASVVLSSASTRSSAQKIKIISMCSQHVQRREERGAGHFDCE